MAAPNPTLMGYTATPFIAVVPRVDMVWVAICQETWVDVISADSKTAISVTIFNGDDAELASLRYVAAMRLAGWHNANVLGPFCPGGVPIVKPPPVYDRTRKCFETEGS